MDPSEQLQHDDQDRLLWARFASGTGGARLCPSAGDLAALIDATAIDAGDRAAIERHLAACPACREAVANARRLIAAQAEAPMTAPPNVIARAQALVEEGHAERPARTAAAPIGRGRDRLRLVPAWLVPARLDLAAIGRWGLSAAASVAVCVLGYHAGARSSAVAAPETDLVNELTFGVGLDGPTDLDLLLAASEESGVGS